MKMIKLLLFVSLFYIVGCSATKEAEESTSEDTQSVYVFDDVTTNDSQSNVAEEVPVTEVAEEEASSTFEFFIVQLGAFSTLEKAETFVSNTRDKTDYELNIHYSEKVNLHVVQLAPFRSREKADEVRDELRNIKEFNGAFIVLKTK